MLPRIALIAVLAACVVSTFADPQPAAPDVTGQWTWATTRPDGSKVTVTLTLKQSGENLTGTFHGEGPDSDIYDGSVKGDQVTFSVKREIEKHNVTLTYTGKAEGQTITGKMSAHIAFKHREEDWQAKRAGE